MTQHLVLHLVVNWEVFFLPQIHIKSASLTQIRTTIAEIKKVFHGIVLFLLAKSVDASQL